MCLALNLNAWADDSVLTMGKPDTFTRGAGVLETIEGVTEAVGAALAGVSSLREQRPGG